MIKFSGTRPNGRNLIVLGLSEINITKMREGLPIHIHGDELGYEGEIVIVVGPTEDALAKKFLDLIPGLEVTDHRSERKN
jgi:hypothetical protein